ncbi:MAG: beta-Ala-His dipeptidase [Emergencia sp.]
MDSQFVLNRDIPIERYFEEISRIPRNSGEEAEISKYLIRFAEERNLQVRTDHLYNVIIRKPASPGYENSEPVMLQAHTDMVCVKAAGSTHDFKTDPLKLYVENGILHAEETSLGADDGFGVAYMLAILDDRSLEHPPLECVFTTQEETGNYGAKGLDFSQIKARRMICLDGDEENGTFVSCFTSERIVLEKVCSCEPAEGQRAEVTLDSMFTNVYGGVCHPENGNAVKVIARLLKMLTEKEITVRLEEMSGGTGENFVPESCACRFWFAGCDAEKLEHVLQKELDTVFAEAECEMFCGNLSVITEECEGSAMSEKDSRELIDLLYLLPNNLIQASIPDKHLIAVNNLGTVEVKGGSIRAVLSTRAKLESSGKEILRQCRTLAGLFGYEMETAVRYSPWPYRKDSSLRKLAKEVYRDVLGTELEEVVCPGGLEIAHFVRGIEGMDAVELGVNNVEPHSVEEAMELASFHRVYTIVTEMLKRMK